MDIVLWGCHLASPTRQGVHSRLLKCVAQLTAKMLRKNVGTPLPTYSATPFNAAVGILRQMHPAARCSKQSVMQASRNSSRCDTTSWSWATALQIQIHVLSHASNNDGQAWWHGHNTKTLSHSASAESSTRTPWLPGCGTPVPLADASVSAGAPELLERVRDSSMLLRADLPITSSVNCAESRHTHVSDVRTLVRALCAGMQGRGTAAVQRGGRRLGEVCSREPAHLLQANLPLVLVIHLINHLCCLCER